MAANEALRPDRSEVGNRRQWPRTPSNRSVICRSLHKRRVATYQGSLLDISQAGASLTIADELRPGDELEIEVLDANGARGHRLAAVIRQTRHEANGQWRIGLQFRDRLTREALSTLIS